MTIRRIYEEGCTGCGICVDVCPQDVIRMDEEKKKAYIAYVKDCIYCMICESLCPFGCIEVAPGRGRPVPMPY